MHDVFHGFGLRIALTFLAGGGAASALEPKGAPPPNDPASVRRGEKRGKLSLTYHGAVLLDAVVVLRGKDGKAMRGGVTMHRPSPRARRSSSD